MDDVSERYLGWLRDEAVSRYIDSAHAVQTLDTIRDYVRQRENRDDVLFLGIFTAEGAHVGNLKFEPLDTARGSAVMGILIGDPEWRGRGVATEVLIASARWLRSERAIREVVLGVSLANEGAIHAYRKAGFVEVSAHRAHAPGPGHLTMVLDSREAGRLALGTAQFGSEYGITNKVGRVPQNEVAAILRCAREAGVDALDTAAVYGESEACLGLAGVADWRIVTKLPPNLDPSEDAATWVGTHLSASLARLRVTSVETLLVHRSQHLAGIQGQAVWKEMRRLKDAGLVEKIGASIYAPEELDDLCPAVMPDVVQAPFSVVDRRLLTSGWLSKLAKLGVEVHARSVFLQGLLLAHGDSRPREFDRWTALWDAWESWLVEHRMTATEAALGYVMSVPEFERVVVGVESAHQLGEIVAAARPRREDVPGDLASVDEDLVNPSRWRRP